MQYHLLSLHRSRIGLWPLAPVVITLSLLTGCQREDTDSVPPPAPAISRADVLVAADGSGDCHSIQEAVNKAPEPGKPRFIIRVKPGTYKEKLKITGKGPISLLGDDAQKTILTFDDYAARLGTNGKPLGTANSYTAKIDSDDFVAENLTFRNSHVWKNADGQQALALSCSGDRAAFRKCRFQSWQDTVYLDRNRQYFEDCVIEGNVDFIFGGATAFFHQCELRCVGPGIAITAASTPREQPFGFVFSGCRITAMGKWKTHFGRPWRPHACVAFVNTDLGGAIAPSGWHNWDDAANEKTARFSEYNSKNQGAVNRVKWAKDLSRDEATKWTVQAVLGGKDNWRPAFALDQRKQ